MYHNLFMLIYIYLQFVWLVGGAGWPALGRPVCACMIRISGCPFVVSFVADVVRRLLKQLFDLQQWTLRTVFQMDYMQ